jgi:hypothetical protein
MGTTRGRMGDLGERIESKAGEIAGQANSLAGDLRQRTSEMSHRTRDRIGGAAHIARDRAMQLAHSAKDQGRMLEQRVERTFEEQPLVMGVAALAVGALVGFALPITRREAQLLGATRDHLLEGAERMAEDALGRMGEFAERAMTSNGVSESHQASSAE